MTIDDQIRDGKHDMILQYDVNKKTAKTSSLSSGKIDKYEYLTGQERLPSIQRQILEETKFSYSPLGKAFRKQRKSIKEQKERQIKAIQNPA